MNDRQMERSAERALKNAQDHAKRGGLRGRYPGEGLRSPVCMMKDYRLGYTPENTVLVCLGALLLAEHGFSPEEIRSFVGRPIKFTDDLQPETVSAGNDLQIGAYLHCALCLAEQKHTEFSPSEYALLNFG